MKKQKPEIVINSKNYKQGKDVVKLAKQIDKSISKEKSNHIIICVNASDIYEVKKATKNLKIYSEHVDFHNVGRATGFILPEAVKADGASGTLLNHSEHKLKWRTIKKTVKRCKQTKLKIILCISNLKQLKKALKLKPEAIAFEVPELISTSKSITQSKPESVKMFACLVNKYNNKKSENIKALCGAGISSDNDIKASVEFGCDGVLIASAVTKARNPGEKLKKLIK